MKLVLKGVLKGLRPTAFNEVKGPFDSPHFHLMHSSTLLASAMMTTKRRYSIFTFLNLIAFTVRKTKAGARERMNNQQHFDVIGNKR